MPPTRYKKTKLKLTVLKLYELFVIFSTATIMCQYSASAQTLEAPLEKSEINLTPEEKLWVSTHTEILVSNSAKWPPIDFISAGQPTGFAVEYMNLIASKVGLRVRFISGPEWENTIQKLRDRELDIINTLSYTAERAEYFAFTPSYIDLPVVHYGKIGSPSLNNPEDFKDKKIGIQDEHKIALTYQKNYPDLNYVIFEDSISALQALSSGEIDIFTDDRETIEYSISQYNIPGLAEIDGAFSFEIKVIDQRFAVHKDNQILFSVINKGMAAVTAQEYNNILQRWISPRSRSMSNLLTSEERMWLSQNNRIRVVVDPTSAPFEFIDEEGEFAGVSAAYLKDIAEQLNVEFIWANNSAWNDGLNMIRSGTADLVSSIAPNEERAEYLIFSEPYFAAPFVIYSKTDGINYNSLTSLNNQTIALIRGYAINALVRTDYPDIQIKEYNNISEVLNAVSSGEAEAYIGSIPVTNYALAENSIENIQITGTTQYTLPSTIGVRSDLPLLASAIDKAVRNIPNISRQTYLTEWLTTVVNPTVVDYGPIWNVVGFSLLAGIAFIFWNRKLSGEIKRRIIIESQLQKASAAKSDFLASMSHELRTPLNAIIGFSETIKAEIFGPLNNKKYTEYNNSIHDSGEYLLGLVEEILDLSALEAKKREVIFKTFEIADLINDCELLIRGQAKEKNIDLIIDDTNNPLTVKTDKKALKQILINLLTNAIKFTPDNGRVSVSYGSKKDNFFLKVTDTGYGISEEDIKIITNPFTQANASPYVTQGEGTGLGLAIAKSLVDLLNGKLKFESSVGNGTIATVSIPLQHNRNVHHP